MFASRHSKTEYTDITGLPSFSIYRKEDVRATEKDKV